VGGGTAGAAGGAAECGAFPPVADVTANGPLATSSAPEGTNCQIYRPATLGGGGVRHPVILWANGTAGPTFVYEAAFNYWASYGFIVAAGNSSNGQGSGAEMLGCLDYLVKQNTTSGSPYEGKVCVSRVGASGHSQGGGGALMAGQDARLTVTAPLMPYIAQGFGGFDTASITKQHGPMLLLSGTADTIAPPDTNQKPVFDTTNVPVFWANLVGGDHVAVSLNGLTTYRNAILGWYRLHLMGDESFRKTFYGANCTLCADTAWQIQRKGIP
jgi:predicted dienelactone hydrolase